MVRGVRTSVLRVALSGILVLVGAPAVCAQYADVPWPAGDPPDSTALDRLVGDAVELAEREQAEEFLEAAEPGEQSEHIRARQEDIDAGRWDNDRLFLFGDSLFEHAFRAVDGYGGSDGNRQRRVHAGVRGGLDNFACASCHAVGGLDGAGTLTQNAFLLGDGRHISSAVVRNPPHVLGLGLVQALAAEVSGELLRLRRKGLSQAREARRDVTVELLAKGVSFGRLIARADGTTDFSGIEGIDPDLVVKPFGWKGEFARLRRFVEDAARIHFGEQSHVLALRARDEPDPERLGNGRNWADPDGDRVEREIEEGSLTATATYLAMLEAPVILPPHDTGLRDRWARGSAVFDQVGCAGCHRRELELTKAWWEEHSDTTDGKPVRIGLLQQGDEPKGSNRVRLFSDLKRHAMGPGLADAHDGPAGLPRDVFLTRPLWGLADTAPYMHDGRAGTIPEAILEHDGEARAARDAYAALPPADRANLSVFLLSLTRAPKVKVAR